MKITSEMLAVARGLSALDTELSLAQRRVDSPFNRDGEELPESVRKFNEHTLARLQSIKAAMDILTAE